MGLRVAGAKLTGVGRYRDILAMRKAGAFYIADFVDAGLPSTVVPPDEFETALLHLCSSSRPRSPTSWSPRRERRRSSRTAATWRCACSPSNVRVTVLCASDPYAVVGVMTRVQERARPDRRPRHEHRGRDRPGREAGLDPGAQPARPGQRPGARCRSCASGSVDRLSDLPGRPKATLELAGPRAAVQKRK